MNEYHCIIVGGPQHGMELLKTWSCNDFARLSVIAVDGEPCKIAARQHDVERGLCCVLLHPLATGQQILTALAH